MLYADVHPQEVSTNAEMHLNNLVVAAPPWLQKMKVVVHVGGDGYQVFVELDGPKVFITHVYNCFDPLLRKEAVVPSGGQTTQEDATIIN